MAEYVHQNLETMLPELEEMERLGIFDKAEIKAIVKRRTAFEYKLKRRVVKDADFLRYIQYELNLDMLRKKRKRINGISKKILPCEIIFIKKLHMIFQSAIRKFSDDVKLWMQYIDFCKRTGNQKTIGKNVAKMLQAHPNNAGLWIMAAKMEFETNSNIKYARTLLQRALRLNSDSKPLWLEYFRLELLHVDKVNKRRKLLGISQEDKISEDPNSQEFLSGQTARIVYKNAIHSIPDDINFRLNFVDIYNLFDATEEGVNDVFESLSRDFPNSEIYWNALALQTLNKAKKQNLSQSDSKWVELISERNEIFDKAVKAIPTEKMWDCYIDACMKDLDNLQSKMQISHLLQLFQLAHKEKKLATAKYTIWVDLLCKNGNFKEALKVSKSTLKAMPDNTKLWLQYFKLKLAETHSFTSALLKEYSEALTKVDSSEGILLLWELWLEYSVFLNISETENIFEESLTLCDDNEVKIKIKEDFLQLFVTKEGIKKARKLYKRLSKEKPISVSFYQKCLEAEKSQVEPNIKQLRQLYESALDDFGSEEPGLWIDYVAFEMKQGDSQLIGQLHWRAMKALSGNNVEHFLKHYTLLMQSVS